MTWRALRVAKSPRLRVAKKMAAPFAEFAGNKRLLWIASEWVRYADKLAEWAMERLVNRRDVWSQYTLKDGKIGVVMLPIVERVRESLRISSFTDEQRELVVKQLLQIADEAYR